ncbi:MAG TPA: hypothetical protein VIR58_14695 [Acidimicrobiales bacterium]
MNRTRAAVALGLMALVAGVAGCGDDDEEPQGAVLGDQLDELAASAAGDGDTTRPEAVALFEGLIADGQADEVAAELSAWIVSRVEPHVGTDPTASVLDEALVPAAAVVAAALDGADEAEADVSSSELENETTRLAREQLSALVAAEAGDPPPEPGSHAETLSEAFPTGDPIERIDLVATRLAEQRTADDDW